MRAATLVAAAWAGFMAWMLDRQHESDLLRSLGTVPRLTLSESQSEGGAR